MRLIRMIAEGISLYEEPIDISFLASQRVQNNHMDAVFHIVNHIYLNQAEAFIGVNASGKTTALRAISFAYHILDANSLSALPPNLRLIKEGQESRFTLYFFSEGKVCKLETVLTKVTNEKSSSIKILRETLREKKISNKLTKKNIFDFEDAPISRERGVDDQYLSDDVSIMIAENKSIPEGQKHYSVDLTALTDYNLYYPSLSDVPEELLCVLDSSVESLSFEKVNGKRIGHLKFRDSEEIVLQGMGDMSAYLSSGTIKGLMVFQDAKRVLQKGGCLLIDEIENHFNRELVVSLLRLFLSRRTNPHGAVIVFSTHYSELLDELPRNDSVFITRREKGLTIRNLDDLLKKKKMKKSEVYDSDYLGGTAPSNRFWSAYRKSILSESEG